MDKETANRTKFLNGSHGRFTTKTKNSSRLTAVFVQILGMYCGFATGNSRTPTHPKEGHNGKE